MMIIIIMLCVSMHEFCWYYVHRYISLLLSCAIKVTQNGVDGEGTNSFVLYFSRSGFVQAILGPSTTEIEAKNINETRIMLISH